jgi:ATP-dependent RNA helicase DHX8/PRP22
MIGSGQEVSIHPGSALVKRRPPCIVFAELLHTTRDYARDATAVDATWLAELAPAFMARHRIPSTHAAAGARNAMKP